MKCLRSKNRQNALPLTTYVCVRMRVRQFVEMGAMVLYISYYHQSAYIYVYVYIYITCIHTHTHTYIYIYIVYMYIHREEREISYIYISYTHRHTHTHHIISYQDIS